MLCPIIRLTSNLIQAAGGSLSLTDALSGELTTESLYDVYGNLLQIIGNSMQAISGIKELKGADDEMINTVGGWIQAIGSILSVIASYKEM
ncbi:hypothetical protein F3157_22865 [Virgibacillus dakarensis]|uniref:Uncharacterized protein n=1 Tax=Lentibacillus populi TaxID=1827502 RepID=A0A9W5U225_9BACI|nr:MULTISPECIES: hypothetical protein [Bacillaceae]MTW88413.1 hypothetical protein [Virgibacillus dakarensis]GGB60907.1 hypothetical protein GCM10011409_42780 [Lentibacillus populi]